MILPSIPYFTTIEGKAGGYPDILLPHSPAIPKDKESIDKSLSLGDANTLQIAKVAPTAYLRSTEGVQDLQRESSCENLFSNLFFPSVLHR